MVPLRIEIRQKIQLFKSLYIGYVFTGSEYPSVLRGEWVVEIYGSGFKTRGTHYYASYDSNGQLHGQPSVQFDSDSAMFLKDSYTEHGVFHRLDGPAYGGRRYYIHGHFLSKEEYNSIINRLKENPLLDWNGKFIWK